MTIEDEIAAVRAAAEKKLRNLRERERKHQQAVDTRLLALLRNQYGDLADRLEATARLQLSDETAQRSAKARASKSRRSEAPLAGSRDPDALVGGPRLEHAR